MSYFFIYILLLCFKASYGMEQEAINSAITPAYNFFINPYRLKHHLPFNVVSVEKNNNPRTVNFNNNSSLLGVGYNDGSISIFDTTTSEQRYNKKLASSVICALTFHAIKELLVAISEHNTVYLWLYSDLTQPITTDQLRNHSCPIQILFTPLEFMLEVRYPTHILLKSLATSRNIVRPLQNAAIYTQDLKYYVKKENDYLIIVNTHTNVPQHYIKKNTNSIESMYFNSDGSYLIVCDRNYTLNFFNCLTGEHMRALKMHTNSLAASALCPNNYLLATLHTHGVILWHLKNVKNDQEIIRSLTSEHHALLNSLFAYSQASQTHSYTLDNKLFYTLPSLVQKAIMSHLKHALIITTDSDEQRPIALGHSDTASLADERFLTKVCQRIGQFFARY